MEEKATMATVAKGWCVIAGLKLAACKAAAERGAFDPSALHDLEEAVEQLGYAFDWLPVEFEANG